jgi:chemotaxis response regulator CheB
MHPHSVEISPGRLKHKIMAGHDIIVIGASTGGVETLRELARGLPPDLLAAVFVVAMRPHGIEIKMGWALTI